MNFIKKIIEWLYNLLFKKNKKDNKSNIYYVKKDYMTINEKSFYIKLKKIEEFGNFRVIPQVNLASVISKRSEYRYNTELFRNIDFGLFDNEFNLLLLIELNDSSHKQASRHQRDLKVKEICDNAGIKLIFFYTNYPNEQNYIIERIKKELEKK